MHPAVHEVRARLARRAASPDCPVREAHGHLTQGTNPFWPAARSVVAASCTWSAHRSRYLCAVGCVRDLRGRRYRREPNTAPRLGTEKCATPPKGVVTDIAGSLQVVGGELEEGGEEVRSALDLGAGQGDGGRRDLAARDRGQAGDQSANRPAAGGSGKPPRYERAPAGRCSIRSRR